MHILFSLPIQIFIPSTLCQISRFLGIPYSLFSLRLKEENTCTKDPTLLPAWYMRLRYCGYFDVVHRTIYGQSFLNNGVDYLNKATYSRLQTVHLNVESESTNYLNIFFIMNIKNHYIFTKVNVFVV